MAKLVEFHEGARRDFDESFDWYAERSIKAAVGFAFEVDEAVDRITADPICFPKTLQQCRSCPIKGYPFRLIYQQRAERIVIVAVAHSKRRPGYWRRRT